MCLKIVQYLGFTIKKEDMQKCKSCALEKAKQKSLPSRTVVLMKLETPKAVTKKV